MSSTSSFKAIFGWSLIALFFCYQYLLRVTPGVISDELRHAFYLTAEEFASLGAFYLYSYSLLQIPIGFIVDRVGIKRTVLTSLFLCIIGTLWLAKATSLPQAQMSRILVGAGSACAFMASLKWIADHFDPGKRGLLMGGTLVFGTIGALGAGRPLVALVDASGWKTAILWTGLLGVLLLILIVFLLKDSQKSIKKRLDITQVGRDLKAIACDKNIVIYAFLAVGVYTPLAVLADLWGVSFLVEKFNITRADAASTTMLMYAGLAIGSLTMPALAEKYNLFTRSIQVCSLSLLGIFSWILMSTTMNLWGLKILFLLIGIFCGAEMICFSGALIGSTPRTSGLTIGFVNTMNMLGGAILQQIIGFGLDLQWTGAMDSTGIRIYTPHQYTLAFSILPAILLLCVLLSLRLRKRDFQTPKT